MRRTIFWSTFFALVGAFVSYLRPLKAVDLHIYHAAAKSYFLLSGPMYGANQEFGSPSLYRYPPLFLFIFRPLASLPFRAVASIWTGLEILPLAPLVCLWYRRYPPARLGPALTLSGLILAPYLLYELQVGNVQLFLIEMICLGLLLADDHPMAAALLLGLATAIKIWPGCMLVALVLRGRWKIGLTALWSAGISSVVPGFFIGWRALASLVQQWYFQELRINALLGDHWYPSESLRGVMLRYFTRMDYSGLPDPNYRNVNFLGFPSWEVRQYWLVLAILIGLAALVCAYRLKSDASAYSILFCAILIIQPNVRGTIFVALLWPVLYAGVVASEATTKPWFRAVVMGVAAMSSFTHLFPGAQAQRWMQVLGADFLCVLLPLTIALCAVSAGESSAGERRSQYDQERHKELVSVS